jgi:DNA-binding response OmpR family regulator
MLPKIKRRVFVVDDENIIASTLELILRNQGFDAHSFTDPLAALDAAQSESPDILIADVVMPEMNGIELATRIRKDSPRCIVLYFSGDFSILDLLAEAKAAGHDFAVLDKPVHPAILIDRINEAFQDAESPPRPDPLPCSPLVPSHLGRV